MGHT
jgi:hypothetical protein